MTSLTPESKNGEFRWNFECAQFAASYRPSDCEEKNTGYNDPGNGLIYLDRHLMQCGVRYAITSFKAQLQNGMFRFAYNCCPGTLMYPSADPTMKPIADPTQVAEPSIFFFQLN